METLKQFAKGLKDKLFDIIGRGDVNQANEITANLMVGAMAFLMALFIGITWALNALHVFTVDPKLMAEAAIVAIAISLLVGGLNRAFKGDKPWLKYVLLVGLVFECGALSCVLGHNVTLVTVIPAVLAIRYFDLKTSIFTSLVSSVAFAISTVVCARIGIVNINVLPVADGTTWVFQDGIRATVMQYMEGADRTAYLWSYIQNDYLPKALAFVVISVACASIAKRGRQMIDLQNEITHKTARIKTELNLATEIQTNVLPCALPAYPEHENLELFAKNIPAKEVGGDFYDYFRVDNDHVAFLIADVSGKGVGAALFMMISKTIIKNQLQLGIAPAEAMMNANAQLCESNSAGLFVTAWAGVYEVSSGTVRYVSAGHNPPVLKRKGEKASYVKGRSGFVLAGMDGTIYRENEMKLEEGDELFLYTDGVTEATNGENELFGEDRLLDCIDRIGSESIKDQVSDMLAEIDKFVAGAEQFDDITMLGMKVH